MQNYMTLVFISITHHRENVWCCCDCPVFLHRCGQMVKRKTALGTKGGILMAVTIVVLSLLLWGMDEQQKLENADFLIIIIIISGGCSTILSVLLSLQFLSSTM